MKSSLSFYLQELLTGFRLKFQSGWATSILFRISLTFICITFAKYICNRCTKQPLFSVALRPNTGHGLLILEVFQITHNDTPQSVGLLWTSDQLVAETSTSQHATLTTDKHPCPGWDSNPRSQQASGRRPTPQTARLLGPAQSSHWRSVIADFLQKSSP